MTKNAYEKREEDGMTHQVQELLPFIIPLAVIEFGLLIAALIHIFTHHTYRRGSRVFWVIVALLFSIIGPVAYFVLGRSDESEER